jgi:hypothetical protein
VSLPFILININVISGFLNVSEKEAFFATEKAVKQVLHQLQHLRKVWHEILPPTNYRKAIGKNMVSKK